MWITFGHLSTAWHASKSWTSLSHHITSLLQALLSYALTVVAHLMSHMTLQTLQEPVLSV
jgi:hypothetical protein